ncbi:TIGR03013 family XrtA/PEP-CTERM system glycosyltransferase [Geopsychrobacter electrodiphilus]|uniref:TIGR03013 family XrtA/PEP-CTERM system glycosyltransferase n=1 Tax=Geopsychrobacter electrodiphilus TaxID=225196 RepID=UPI00037ECD15|nr:TIGR03013 family XrtA/PEP-CTERM system glycosyltransferase [Geopsychrobacter electrodiphilus]
MIRPKFILILCDLALAFGCLASAFDLRFGQLDEFGLLPNDGLLRLLIYLFVVELSTYYFEMYEPHLFRRRAFIVERCIYSSLASFFLLSALFYLLPDLQFGRGLLSLYLLLTLCGQIFLRLLARQFLRTTRFANRVLIIGVGKLAQTIAEVVPKDMNLLSYVRFVSCGKEKPLIAAERIVGHIDELSDLVQDYRPQQLILALAERRGALPLKEIMHCKIRGVEVFDAATYYEKQTGRLMVENIQPSAFIFSDGFRITSFMRSTKRILDLIFAGVGLLLVSPIIPLLALAIKLDSPGPIFYKQLRVGELEVEYFVYKFRTMRLDAESETGAVWAQKQDPRVTRIGKFMRKCRLDEIPQLYNVLKGDMSFIGPRPERQVFVDRLKETIPFYSTRHFIKPGVTGWAQVCYPYGASDEDALEKLRYDLYYIKNYSIFLDLKIIKETVNVVLSGFGGR